jgi:hypothetical protein
MKTIVSVQEVDELEIKPQSEVSAWRHLVASEIRDRWSDRSGWLSVSCPCCAEEAKETAFERVGIPYVECPSCQTLYAPQRPDEDSLSAWYRDSLPARFWRDRLLVASRDMRRDKIVLPRARWVMDSIAEYVPRATRLLDVSTNGRPLVDAVLEESPALEAWVTGPTADIEKSSQERVLAQPTPVAGLTGWGPMHLVTAVDALDRAANLPALVRAAHDALVPDGVLLATIPVASGFEIQSLWDRSPSILPPDKLNLPTIEGLQRLFDDRSWALLELSTPGMFDVEIIRRTMSSTPEAEWPRALRALVEHTDVGEQRRLIEYLQSRRLTSFARVVARRID